MKALMHSNDTVSKDSLYAVAPKPRTEYLKKSLRYQGTIQWNSLDKETRSVESLASLKTIVKADLHGAILSHATSLRYQKVVGFEDIF